MSFLENTSQPVLMKIRSGYSYGPRVFQYGHYVDGVFAVDVNDGWEAQLEVACVKGGVPVYTANTEDSGSGLIIDPDIVLVEFELDPSQSAGLDFVCCQFVLFLYKGDVLTPTDKKPFLHGEIRVV